MLPAGFRAVGWYCPWPRTRAKAELGRISGSEIASNMCLVGPFSKHALGAAVQAPHGGGTLARGGEQQGRSGPERDGAARGGHLRALSFAQIVGRMGRWQVLDREGPGRPGILHGSLPEDNLGCLNIRKYGLVFRDKFLLLAPGISSMSPMFLTWLTIPESHSEHCPVLLPTDHKICQRSSPNLRRGRPKFREQRSPSCIEIQRPCSFSEKIRACTGRTPETQLHMVN